MLLCLVKALLLRRVTARCLRWLLKPFFAAGATMRDVLPAVDVRPDDSRWTYTWSGTAGIRHVPGWVGHRLAGMDQSRRPSLPVAVPSCRSDEPRRRHTSRSGEHEQRRPVLR
ncbi:hypothetical protein HD597_005405 [Nonomuraea thailandensis]|uniref:Uncharacterized protein n=1 Tax=Nonomuraea thailandensis TaxID=1188745 RepID=A0A9X2GIL1_9ACTN|nr:hypothetical protein [Nonomuraea thailandensis]MCP2358385.1 hypothetical protein [Nonomuraea thailandensis]